MSKFKISTYNTFTKQKHLAQYFEENDLARLLDAQRQLQQLTRFEAFTIVLTEKLD